jgi:hypothetical protein
MGSNPIAGRLIADLTTGESVEVQQVIDGMLRERSGGGGSAVLSHPVHIGIGTR